MPALAHRTYLHKAQYRPEQLVLDPRQKKERRFIPNAYTPQGASIRITLDETHFDIDYSVKESGHIVELMEGIKVVFGKSTKKVLNILFMYSALEQLPAQMSDAAKTIKARQNEVPQDSIKRNYQITADLILLVRDGIKGDLDKLHYALTHPPPNPEDVPISI